ncbi:MAG: TIGR02221 family CRISPR-associated protein, partial [Desulforhabdus sp.]|nr:TIGR02221 family CRISPR-associated protein [Desulforhabdus sp.]
MGNLYLSFLGTNDYLPCTYFSEDGREVPDVRFVQEATARLCCENWSRDDKVIIFTTEEAYRKNWIDDGHKDYKGNTLSRTGLKTCLARCDLQPKIQHISIPEGKSEGEIWRIFQIVFDCIQSEDHVIFDITHAFRSIPMLALVVLTYAKTLRGASIEGIWYGAFEALGPLGQVAAMPLPERRVPIFSLGAFVTLMDWSMAIEQFVQSGDARPICSLAQNKVKPILRDTKGRDQSAVAIRDLADKLEAFTEALSTCRGKDISRLGSELHLKISRCRNAELLPPLLPLLDLLEKGVYNFIGNEVYDGLQAVRWCMSHGLTQQAYTILREVLITHFAENAGVDPKVREQREAATYALYKSISKETVAPREEDQSAI